MEKRLQTNSVFGLLSHRYNIFPFHEVLIYTTQFVGVSNRNTLFERIHMKCMNVHEKGGKKTKLHASYVYIIIYI
jgi:hypothetical protein